MPPVSTPSSASAGPGSATAVSATWRRPSPIAAACRAAPSRLGQTRHRRARPVVRPIQRPRSDRAEQPCQRAGRRLRPTAKDGGERTGDRQRRIRAIFDAESGQQAGEIGHADREPRCRGSAQGQRGDRGLHRLGERGRIEAAGAHRGTRRGSARSPARPPPAPARPTRMARHAAAAASGAAARPAAPPARRAARVRPPDGSRHRPPPPASPAPRRAPGRPAQPPPCRPRPPAASPAAPAHRDPRPPSRGASARPARSGWSSCPHARRAPATRKALFCVHCCKRPQNPVDEPPGGPEFRSFVYRAA